MILKRIDPLSCAKIYGLLTAVIGLFVGLALFVVTSIFGGMMESMPQSDFPSLGKSLGALTVILLPILYGVIGFIAGFISAAVYNILASVVGGVKIDLIEE